MVLAVTKSFDLVEREKKKEAEIAAIEGGVREIQEAVRDAREEICPA